MRKLLLIVATLMLVAGCATPGENIASQGNASYKVQCPVVLDVNGAQEVHLATFDIQSGRNVGGNLDAAVPGCFNLKTEGGLQQGEERKGLLGATVEGIQGIVGEVVGGGN